MSSPETPGRTPRPKRATTLREAAPGLRRTGRHVRPHLARERTLLLGGLLALLAEVAMRLLEPWPLKFVIDGVVAASGGTAGGAQPAGLSLGTVLLLAAVGLFVVVLLRAVTAYLTTLCFALAGSRLLARVRSDAFAHLQRLSMDFHDRARTGDLVTRVTSDVGRLREVAVTAALPLVGNVLTMAGMVTVVAILDWQLALLMLSVLPLFLLTGRRHGTKINGVSKRQRRAEGALASLATDSLTSMRVVQTYSMEQRLHDAFASSNTKTLKDGVKAKKLAAGLERKTDVLVGIATALVLYVGALRVVDGALTAGELVVFLTYLKATFKPMRDLAKYTGRIAQAAASGERLVDLLEERPTVTDSPHAVPAPTLRGDVELRDVWLSYEPGHHVLRGLHLRVPAGQRVALVGPSGAGKSSVAGLLSRLRDPDCGAVALDGHDLRHLTLDTVRPQVAVVLQESVLFAASVRDNIAWGCPDATDDDVVRAARLAGVEEFVHRLPEGYDTVVGERGDTLSGGQRQRIAIARAAVRDAPVVILDEATSGLDEGTEREVVEALRRLTEGRTTLVVTHDLAAARECDRVVWLDRGQVLADGSPDEVLGRAVPGVRDVAG